MRIYLSSTSADLSKQRNTVIRALRNKGHDVLCMEDYTAEGRPPLTKCLEDVASVDIYIGILAWRYGDSPPETPDVSFTENEYNEARTRKIPTLCFVMDQEFPWPQSLVDKGVMQGRIEKFRERVRQENIVTLFKSDDELTHGVREALSQYETDHAINFNPPMVGQERARRCLKNALAGVIDRNRVKVVFVEGEVGSGKGKLLEWFRSYIRTLKGERKDREDDTSMEMEVYGGSYLDSLGSYYRGIREVLQKVFSIEDKDIEGTRKQVEGHLSKWKIEPGQATIDFFVDFLRRERPTEPEEQEPDNRGRDIFFHQVARPLIKASLQVPLVIYLENLHFADEGSIRFVEHMLGSLRDENSKLLMVCMYDSTGKRSNKILLDAIDRIMKRYDSNSIDFVKLEPLDDEEMVALINSMLGKRLAGAETIVAMAQGNPHHVVEIIRFLVTEQRLEEHPTEWVLPASLDMIKMVPTQLTGLIENRLARIEMSDSDGAWRRQVIDYAALIGERFSPLLLDLALKEAGETSSQPALNPALEYLVDEAEIFRSSREFGLGVLEFTQSLIREVVLREIKNKYKTHRRHACIARTMERLHAGEIADFAHELAHHYLEAGEPEPASKYFQEAAQVARGKYNYSDACKHLKQAYDLLKKPGAERDPTRLLSVLLSLGDLMSICMSIDEANEYYNEALSISQSVSARHEQVRSLIGLGNVARLKGNQALAVQMINNAKELCTDTTLDDFRPRILKDIAQACLRVGDYQRAVETCGEWLAINPGRNLPASEAEVLRIRGTVYLYKGDLDNALSDFSSALSLARTADDKLQIAYCSNCIGEVYRKRNQLDQADVFHQQAYKLRVEIGDVVGIAMSYNNLGLIKKAKGCMPDAAELFSKAVKKAKDIGSDHRMADSLNNLATLKRLNKEYVGALELYDECYKIYSAGGMKNEEAIVKGNIALVLYAQANVTGAIEALSASAMLFEEKGNYACATLAYHNLVCILSKHQSGSKDIVEIQRKCHAAKAKVHGYLWPDAVEKGNFTIMVDMEDI